MICVCGYGKMKNIWGTHYHTGANSGFEALYTSRSRDTTEDCIDAWLRENEWSGL